MPLYLLFSGVRFRACPRAASLGECKLDFYSAIFEVHARRYQGQALLLALANQFSNLFLMYQQLTSAEGGVIIDISMLVGTDVAVEEPQFAIFNQPVGVFQIDVARPYGLDLRTC